MAGGWVLAGGRVLAGEPTTAQPPQGLIELIDFLAAADNGQPVTDLAPSEVTFKLDGRLRAIRSLQFVELASQTPVDRRLSLGAPLAAPYGSNRLDDLGRTVMIALDRESIRPGRERPARDAALRFLATLSARDRVGLGTLPRVEVDLTNDHEQIREALMRMTGLASQERTASEAACRSRLILNTLTGMLQSMAALDGPKTIAFISTGIVPPTRDAPMAGPPGQCEITTVDYDQVAAAASLARAHFYVIQPNDEGIDSARNAFGDPSASRFRSASDNLAGLQSLAGVTGGELYRLNAVQADAVFARVARESSAYYVIAFEPEPGERNGQPHRVEIKVARERVTVRTRPFFTIARTDAKAGDLTPQRMLREARQFRDLPLRATAYASAGDPGDPRLKVIAAAEPMDPSVSLASAAAGLFDAKGKLAAQWSAEKGELASLPLMSALPVPPGPYRLRVAAVDSTGRRGTVDYLFQVGLESAGKLKLSGMALGTLRGGFRPKLQFGSDPAAVGYFEIYGKLPSSAEVTVRFEVAETEDGPALSSIPGRLQPTLDDARRSAIGSVPIATLSPGDYVVRAVLNLDGRPIGTVRRTLRKTG